MTTEQMAVEVLKWGMGGAVLVVIFWKFIPSLFEFLQARNADDKPGLAQANRQRIAANQQRLDRLEKDFAELRGGMSEMRVAVEVSKAILIRIEDQVCKKAGTDQ